jgi:hypothetical protein
MIGRIHEQHDLQTAINTRLTRYAAGEPYFAMRGWPRSFVGLKPETAKGPVDVVVIDHINRPSET